MATVASAAVAPSFENLITLEAAAVRIDASRSKVAHLVSRGEIRAIKFGARCVRIDRQSVDDYLVRRQRDRVEGAAT